MVEVTNHCFKYAIELNTIIDEYKGECSFDHLIKVEQKKLFKFKLYIFKN